MADEPATPNGYDPALLTRFFEERIPFNAWLGIRIEALGRGSCVLRLPARPELVGNPGLPAVHGGVLSTLCDTAGGLAVFTALSAGHSVSTVDLRVDYLRPGKVDAWIFASAEVVRLGNRVAVANCEIWQDDPTNTIAQGRGVYNIHRGGISLR